MGPQEHAEIMQAEALSVNGTGNDTRAIQRALVDAGYDIGHNADGTPMVDGLEESLTRAAVEEYAQDQGLDLNEITAGELVAAIENTVQTQKIAQQMHMDGADVTIAGDPGFIQENAASIGVPMPEPQQPAPGISPQQPQMGAPGQMA